jgi:TPR repeat protein
MKTLVLAALMMGVIPFSTSCQAQRQTATPPSKTQKDVEQHQPLLSSEFNSFDRTRALAEKGDAKAQNDLGEMYRNGKGVPKDAEQAVVWIRKAAEQGNTEAQNTLSAMYFTGEGVAKDFQQAVKWSQKAAEQGDSGAQCNLGLMYASVLDLTRAYMWWIISAQNGNETASENEDHIRKFVSSNQIQEARQMARDWVSAHPSRYSRSKHQ